MIEPTIALAMPPPISPIGFGIWVRNAQLRRADAFVDQIRENREERQQHENHVSTRAVIKWSMSAATD